MPTARGWMVGVAGFGVWVGGRIFGAQPLEQVGFGLLALVLIALAVLRFGSHDLEVTRILTPERVRAGGEVLAHITIVNKGRGSAPLLLLEDRLPPELSGRARFAVNGIESGGSRDTDFELKPARRGRYSVGPLEITFTDPFGLARTKMRAAPQTGFLAYPASEKLSLPRDTGHRKSLTASAKRQPTGQQGEDFYTLREYIEGDDLRRIHWPSTAKRARYMVRQEETPWSAKATILLDDRAGPYSGAAFDKAVEATASVADLYHRSGYAFRLAGATSPGVQSGRGSEHWHLCLDLLAVIETQPGVAADESMLGRLAELEQTPNLEGSLIVITGTLEPAIANGLIRCARRYKTVTAISVPAHRFSVAAQAHTDGAGAATELAGALERGGVRSIVIGPGDALGPAWSGLGRSPHEGGDASWDLKREPA
ncbi:MAG: hypothetical protein QOH90_1685 [Actinomycetota bacterium]|nr:hypothetical protein [Actinomycetota bacterium]